MFYRQNKNSPWKGTLSYNFTRLITRKKVSLVLKIALLLTDNKTMKGRKEILKKLKEPNYKRQGQLACAFTALNINEVIYYNKKNKCYEKGSRHKEYLEYTLSLLNKYDLKKKYREIYLILLKEISHTLHFIMEDNHVQKKTKSIPSAPHRILEVLKR